MKNRIRKFFYPTRDEISVRHGVVLDLLNFVFIMLCVTCLPAIFRGLDESDRTIIATTLAALILVAAFWSALIIADPFGDMKKKAFPSRTPAFAFRPYQWKVYVFSMIIYAATAFISYAVFGL